MIMQLEINRRADLSLDLYHRVAWHGQRIRLGTEALRCMADSRQEFMRLIDNDPNVVIYGVTSGYGQFASMRLEGEARRKHARKPPRATVAAFGPAAPERLSRGIVLSRLANFIEGHAAVTPELAVEIAALLDGAALPKVSLAGQGGAGEILWAAPLFLEVAERFPVAEKEVLALINGAPAASALIADAALAMRRRLDLVEQVFALSTEAIKAPVTAYATEFEDLWDDPYETQSLQRLRLLLEGGSVERRPYQAPVSYRILPRVIGQFRRVIAQAEEIAASSLRSVTDNPVFLRPDPKQPNPDHPYGRVYSNGGYHNARAYPALDNLAAACADLCMLAERQTIKLLDGRYSLMPDQLMGAEGGYVGILGFVQVGYSEQARRAAQRTFLPGSEAGGFGQNDVAPLTGLAWSAQEDAGRCLDAALTMLAVVASQAFHVTQRAAPPALEELQEIIRSIFPPVAEPRPYAPQLTILMETFREGIYDVAESVGG
jgi:histidine ammonia-lyase